MQKYAISNRQGIKANIFTDIDELYNKYVNMCDTSLNLHNLESILDDLENYKYFPFFHKGKEYYILKLSQDTYPEYTLPEYSFFKKNNSKDSYYTNNFIDIYKKCMNLGNNIKLGSVEYIIDTLKKKGFYEITCNNDTYYIFKFINKN